MPVSDGLRPGPFFPGGQGDGPVARNSRLDAKHLLREIVVQVFKQEMLVHMFKHGTRLGEGVEMMSIKGITTKELQ